MTPLFSLLTTFFIAVSVLFFFWPETGLFWKWKRGLASARHVLVEDALKHIHDQEYNRLPSTLNSLSGALFIPRDDAAVLLARLESLRLIRRKGDGFELTSDGRKEALRVIRIHRLLERYLADETGLSQTEWHKRAEKREHRMTEKQIEALASYMGNPSYDPHGDPIPTASGKLPPKKGIALTELQVDDIARIVHVEDEPATVYAQLVAERLHPGQQIRVLDKTDVRLTFVAEGEEVTLAPVVAANLTVMKIETDDEIEPPLDTLASLTDGEKAEVITISRNCRGQQRRRMLDLGVIPGTIISMEMRSPSGDPTAYNIRGATIALRKEQASLINVKKVKEAA